MAGADYFINSSVIVSTRRATVLKFADGSVMGSSFQLVDALTSRLQLEILDWKKLSTQNSKLLSELIKLVLLLSV